MTRGERNVHIHLLREQAGLSISEVARRLGVSRQYVGQMERGVNKVPDNTYERICEMLTPKDETPFVLDLNGTRTKRNGGDARGNNLNRKRRKLFLLAKFGDGETCPCWRCGCTLTFETLTVDRIIPGCDGGTYQRNNIRPACATDNSKDGGKLGVERKRLRKLDAS